LHLPLWATTGAESFAAEVASHKGVVLGAYCGDVSETPESETFSAFESLLKLALDHQLDVDLHIDETNNPGCCALATLSDALAKARAGGYSGHVMLSHVTSFALQPRDKRSRLVSALRELGNLTVVRAKDL
jgi:cytosine deaminase